MHALQDAFLPGVTKGTVAEGLARRFSADGAHRFRGRDMTGWYLQQVHMVGLFSPPWLALMIGFQFANV